MQARKNASSSAQGDVPDSEKWDIGPRQSKHWPMSAVVEGEASPQSSFTGTFACRLLQYNQLHPAFA